MTLTWNAACDLAGFFKNDTPPTTSYQYYGYSAGKVHGPFQSKEEAAVFPHHEKVVVNADAIESFWKQRRSLESEAARLFHSCLRQEYAELSDEAYNLCYAKAYEDGHSSGYDEVANYLAEYASFAARLYAAAK